MGNLTKSEHRTLVAIIDIAQQYNTNEFSIDSLAMVFCKSPGSIRRICKNLETKGYLKFSVPSYSDATGTYTSKAVEWYKSL